MRLIRDGEKGAKVGREEDYIDIIYIPIATLSPSE